MVECRECAHTYKALTNTHLLVHGLTIAQYEEKHGIKVLALPLAPALLEKTDARYIAWRKSLEKRPAPWSVGRMKDKQAVAKKISETFKKKQIDNFRQWRDAAKQAGTIRASYPALVQDEQLAFLIGLVLGDGSLYKHKRTEDLRITLGTDKPELIEFVVHIVEKVLQKKPTLYYPKQTKCVVVRLYEKELSSRLGIPFGARTKYEIALPEWIAANATFLRAYLRGLYEAEGSFSVHEKTYTYKFLFNNKNDSLHNIVYTALVAFGYHPHYSAYKTQISRREEAYKLMEFLRFRDYSDYCRVV